MTQQEAVDAKDIVRGIAIDVSSRYGAGVIVEVERLLRSQAVGRNTQYADPTAIGALIISAGTLAWQVYNDLSKRNSKGDSQTLRSEIVVRLAQRSTPSSVAEAFVIDAAVEQVRRQMGLGDEDETRPASATTPKVEE